MTMTVNEVLETLELHARSSVVNVEPKTVAQWVVAIRRGLEEAGHREREACAIAAELAGYPLAASAVRARGDR